MIFTFTNHCGERGKIYASFLLTALTLQDDLGLSTTECILSKKQGAQLRQVYSSLLSSATHPSTRREDSCRRKTCPAQRTAAWGSLFITHMPSHSLISCKEAKQKLALSSFKAPISITFKLSRFSISHTKKSAKDWQSILSSLNRSQFFRQK